MLKSQSQYYFVITMETWPLFSPSAAQPLFIFFQFQASLSWLLFWFLPSIIRIPFTEENKAKKNLVSVNQESRT